MKKRVLASVKTMKIVKISNLPSRNYLEVWNNAPDITDICACIGNQSSKMEKKGSSNSRASEFL
jgi:hypothetical protein